jgi:hypothetical protein
MFGFYMKTEPYFLVFEKLKPEPSVFSFSRFFWFGFFGSVFSSVSVFRFCLLTPRRLCNHCVCKCKKACFGKPFE